MPVESFNASVYLLDRQVEAGRGGHLAVTGPAGSLTYAELSQRVAELSSGLQALGVRPEERVLLVTSDRPETVITFLALLRMGAVAVPVSTMYNGPSSANCSATPGPAWSWRPANSPPSPRRP
jgi:acyl-coenzyme A synthetase/AMP-(fatty) acid ligase